MPLSMPHHAHHLFRAKTLNEALSTAEEQDLAVKPVTLQSNQREKRGSVAQASSYFSICSVDSVASEIISLAETTPVTPLGARRARFQRAQTVLPIALSFDSRN